MKKVYCKDCKYIGEKDPLTTDGFRYCYHPSLAKKETIENYYETLIFETHPYAHLQNKNNNCKYHEEP
jgi:hypothetical protein